MAKKAKQSTREKQPARESHPFFPPTPASLSKEKLLVLLALLLAVVCFLAYTPALNGELLLDDTDLIREDHRIRDFSHLPQILTKPFFVGGTEAKGVRYYRPIVSLSFLLNFQVAGESTWIYHITNIFAHIIASILVFRIALLFFSSAWPPLIIALLFALHPSRTENVAWISGRTDLLGGLFFMLSFFLFLLAEQSRKSRLRVFSFFAFVVALLAKESVIILPLLLALFVFFSRSGRGASLFGKIREALAKTWPFFGAAFLFSLFLYSMDAFGDKIHGFANPLDHLLYISHTINLYSGLILLPTRFHHIVTALLPEGLLYHPPPAGAGPVLFATVISLFALTLWAWFYRRRPRLSFFLLAWLVVLLPALNIRILPSTVAIRLLYVSLFFALFALWLLWEEALEVAGKVLGKKLPGFAFRYLPPLAIVLLLGGITYSQCINWKNDRIFWASMFKAAPGSANANYLRGMSFYDESRPGDALPHFQKAYEIAPKNSLFSLMRGKALLDLQKFVQAEKAFLETLKISPGYAEAANRLGVAYDCQGKKEAARKWFKKSIALAPGVTQYYVVFGVFLMQQGNYENAIQQFESALQLNSTHVHAHAYLGLAHFNMGNRPRALEILEKGRRLDPENQTIMNITRHVMGQTPPGGQKR